MKNSSKNKNEKVKALLLQILNNQLKDNNPPITGATLNRLKEEGYSEADAKELMLDIVWAEIFTIMEQGEPFNLKRYENAMNQLPNLFNNN
jgi:hypothetical protein